MNGIQKSNHLQVFEAKTEVAEQEEVELPVEVIIQSFPMPALLTELKNLAA